MYINHPQFTITSEMRLLRRSCNLIKHKRPRVRVNKSPLTTSCVAAIVLAAQLSTCVRPQSNFDVHQHLSTRTRYANAPRIPNAPSIHDLPDPAGYIPVHLYLLSRHGTRWPTKKRMKQIGTLEHLFRSAASGAHGQFPWMRDWQSPYRHSMGAAGELHPVGEEELWSLGLRLRHRFPQLLAKPYLPDRFPIVSTQVPRAAASATAFAAGFFPEVPVMTFDQRGMKQEEEDVDNMHRVHEQMCGIPTCSINIPGQYRTRPQPVSMSMLPKLADPLLRFFDVCPAFLHHEDFVERWLATWMRGTWQKLGQSLQERLNLQQPMAPCLIDALWQLCQEEAGLWGNTNTTCSLFTREELLQLEWLSDVRVVETMAWGAPVNYNMAAHLAQDLRDTLKAVGGLGGQLPIDQQARLLFAHAETIVPFATLLGLFRPQTASLELPAEGERTAVEGLHEHWVEEEVIAADSIEEDVPLLLADLDEGCVDGKRHAQLLPVPPGWTPRIPLSATRWWRGATVSPYGANLAIITYKRAAATNLTHERDLKNLTAMKFDMDSTSTVGTNKGNVSRDGSHRVGRHNNHSILNTGVDEATNISDGFEDVTGISTGNSHGGDGLYQGASRDRSQRAGGKNKHSISGVHEGTNIGDGFENVTEFSAANGGDDLHRGARCESDYVVRLLYNEQVVPFPGCGSDLECPLEVVVELLGQLATAEHLALVQLGRCASDGN